MTAKELAIVGMMSALTAAGAQISVPIFEVPFTLQLFFVILSGLVLRPNAAFLSQLVYVSLGALGLPVFANFKGGLAHIFGPTGGYIVSFPIAAFFIAKISSKNGSNIGRFLAVICGILVVYSAGGSWLYLYLRDFSKVLFVGVLPFIPIDIAKGVLAIFTSGMLKRMNIKFQE